MHDFLGFIIFLAVGNYPEAHPVSTAESIHESDKKIRLLLIEDNRLLREGIISLIREHDDIRVVAALGTHENILKKCEASINTIPSLIKVIDSLLVDPSRRLGFATETDIVLLAEFSI